MFRKYYEQALSGSGEDSHFAFRLQNLFRLIKEEEGLRPHQQEERDKLRQIIKLKRLLDAKIDREQQHLVESYEANAKVQSERSMQLKAVVLEEGLDECIEYLDEDRQDRWERKRRKLVGKRWRTR